MRWAVVVGLWWMGLAVLVGCSRSTPTPNRQLRGDQLETYRMAVRQLESETEEDN